MGAFLSEPVTDKEAYDEESEYFNYGANSMQGWRVTQEDAHNCLLNFDDDISFFAVYDGHGGPEVAQYCARYLPDFIKNTEAYKNKLFTEALTEGFLGFDRLLTTPSVLEELKQIANRKVDSEPESEEYSELFEEAQMPLEKLLAKYQSIQQSEKAKKDASEKSDSDSVKPGPSGSGDSPGNVSDEGKSCSSVDDSQEKNIELEEKSTTNGSEKSISDSSCTSEATGEKVCNGVNLDSLKDEECSEDLNKESSKGKKTKPLEKGTAKTKLTRSVQSIYKALAMHCEQMVGSSESDESDEDFDGGSDGSGSSNLDESDSEMVPSGEDSEDIEEEEEEDVEEVEEEEEEDDGILITDRQEALKIQEFQSNLKSEPGCDSGCTSVVALLHKTNLYVANAGDSRCVLCRNGEAVEMSFDHKPEDEIETKRINKAGGIVTRDGRVNGGLNLSRAIGDHGYKTCKELDLKDQMITALPDVKMVKLSDYDEFIVLACDGIWNSMSSQEVVNFVRDRLLKHKVKGRKISEICGELFDQCLAPNTSGDGTGCDNMTAIIIQIKKLPNCKRQADDDGNPLKKIKIGDM